MKEKPRSTTTGRKALSEQAAGERVGANSADEGPWVAGKERKDAGDQVGNMHGYREKRGRGSEGNKPPKQKRVARERPVQGAGNGPRMAEGSVGPRHRVAGGPVG